MKSTYIEDFNSATKKVKAMVVVFLFVLVFVLSRTSVYYTDLTPFAVSLVFALFYLKFNGYILAICFLLAYFFANVSFDATVVSLVVSLVLVPLQYIVVNKKLKGIPVYWIYIFSLLSLMGYIGVNIGGTKENLAVFVSVVLSQLFLYICIKFMSALFRRGVWVGLNIDDKICGAVILIVFILGLSTLSMKYFSMLYVVLGISIPLLVYTLNTSHGLVVSSVMGLAMSIYYIDASFVSMLVIMYIVCLAFRGRYRIISCLALMLSYIIFVLVFGLGFVIGEIVSLSIGLILFVLLPRNILDRLSDKLSLTREVEDENIIKKIKEKMSTRLRELSLVFGQMDKTYRDMVRGNLEDDKAIDLLKSEVIRTVCEGCPERDNCYKSSGSFIDNAMDMVVANGYEKGKVLLIDLPQYLTSNCIRVSRLVNELNTNLIGYKEFTTAISNIDASRMLIAEQLLAVSRLMEGLSSELTEFVRFDKRLEVKIREELLYRDIICISSVVYERNVSVKEVSLIITNETLDVKKLEKIVSKLLGTNMLVIESKPSVIPGSTIINLISSPNYDIAFGSRSIKKSSSKVSGDNHSIVKIEEGKFLVSICDGMGSGDRANSISSLSIRLIENFYRAGFDTDIILSSVNKLLSLNEEENFSTLDLCLIDTRKNTYDFIKLASACGYILRNTGECEVIESTNLPVGILDEISPHTMSRLVSNMDILVFVSDGVEESFGGSDNLKNYLSTVDIINPETLCDSIVSRAKELSGGNCPDDMTAVAVRVFACK